MLSTNQSNIYLNLILTCCSKISKNKTEIIYIYIYMYISHFNLMFNLTTKVTKTKIKWYNYIDIFKTYLKMTKN